MYIETMSQQAQQTYSMWVEGKEVVGNAEQSVS
jgi:hypothetical protein